MESPFFSGSSVAKLDDKGRFVIPQAMRYALVEDGKLEFTIGLGLGGCLTIYRNSEMKKIVEKFQKKQHIAKFQKFFTLFFSTLHKTTCDKVGRVMIPSLLKQAVGIDKEVVVAGVIDKIEIWSKKVYDESLKDLFSSEEKAELPKVMEEVFSLLSEEDEKVSLSEMPEQVLTHLTNG